MISICTPTTKKLSKKMKNPIILTFPDSIKKTMMIDDVEFLFSNVSGIGAARADLMNRSTGQFIIMLDDDIVATPELIGWLRMLDFGEFAMAKVDGHVSTRVFAIHRYDYDFYTDGFDPSIKYVFEDGALYVSAIQNGLECRAVPSNLYKHKEHVNRTGDKRWIKSWWEHSRMLAKYKRYVYPNIVGYFGLKAALKQPQVFLVKFVGLIFWLIKGAS